MEFFAPLWYNNIEVFVMIKVTLTNEILKYITEIEKNRYQVSSVKLPKTVLTSCGKTPRKKAPMPPTESKAIRCRRSRLTKRSKLMSASIF